MQRALDNTVFKDAVGEARTGMGTFVVRHIIRATQIVDREPLVADLVGLHRFRRDLGLRTNPDNTIRHINSPKTLFRFEAEKP